MRGCLWEDLLYLSFKTDFRDFIVSLREKNTNAWSITKSCDHARSGINLQPVPTSGHIFVATTQEHPQPLTTNHN